MRYYWIGSLRVDPMPFPAFDRSKLKIKPLAQRQHDLTLAQTLPLDATLPFFDQPAIPVLGQRLAAARKSGSARIMFMGAHVLRSGVSRYIIDLLEQGLLSHIAMNG